MDETQVKTYLDEAVNRGATSGQVRELYSRLQSAQPTEKPYQESKEIKRGDILPFKAVQKENYSPNDPMQGRRIKLAMPKILEDVGTAVKSAYLLPGDVATGKVNPISEEGQTRARDFAGLIAGGEGGGEISKQAEKPALKVDFAEAVKSLGINFSKAKTDEAIAQELKRGTDAWVNKTGSQISDRETQVPNKTSQVGDTGRGLIQMFKTRKTNENTAWNAAEPLGNAIAWDTKETIDTLKSRAKEREDQVLKGTATDVSKADLNLINGAITRLGGSIDKPQNIEETIREIGGRKKVTTAGENAKQFHKSAEQTSTLTPQATTISKDGRIVGSTESAPVNRAVAVDGKVKTTETSPYTVTTKKIKGEPPKPERAGSVGDLVRAMKYVNSEEGAAASAPTRKIVRSAINDQLAEASKANSQFGKLHKGAIDWTQRNADMYRDEGKLSQMGFKEKDLWDVHNKINNGRMLGLDDVQKLNNLSDKIKTKEDLLFFRRLLPREQYNTLMRAKFSTLMSDINMHSGKFEDARPLLEEMMKQSNFPKQKIASELNNYQAVSEKLTEAGVDASGKISKAEKDMVKLRELQKAVLFGGAMHNPKQGLFHGIQAIMPSPTKEQMALRGIKKVAAPPRGSNYTPIMQPVAGASVASVLGESQQ